MPVGTHFSQELILIRKAEKGLKKESLLPVLEVGASPDASGRSYRGSLATKSPLSLADKGLNPSGGPRHRVRQQAQLPYQPHRTGFKVL